MCLLSLFPNNVQPDIEALRRGTICNPDGFGYAIVIPDEKRILVRKFIAAGKALHSFEAERKRYPHGPALFHSRLATDGANDKFNIHPFMINGDTRTVMAHNGIFTQARPSKGDDRSDTRIVAQEIAPQFNLRSRRGRKRFGRWMGNGNKVVILTVDPTYTGTSFIINQDQGIWADGAWHSNTGFRPFYNGNYRYMASYGWEEDYPRHSSRYWWETEMLSGAKESCPVCLAVDAINRITRFCTNCRSCADCESPLVDCLCYLTIAEKQALSDEESKTQRAIAATPATPEDYRKSLYHDFCGQDMDECVCIGQRRFAPMTVDHLQVVRDSFAAMVAESTGS